MTRRMQVRFVVLGIALGAIGVVWPTYQKIQTAYELTG
jgi:hypothetical protein